MNHLRLLLIFFVLGTVVTLADAGIAAAGDWGAVVADIEQANATGGGEVRLSGDYLVDVSLPAITADIFIRGNGATLRPADAFGGQLVRIATTGRLRMTDVHVTRFARSTDEIALVHNQGLLVLDRVTFASNPLNSGIGTPPLLSNEGTARLNNVTLYQNEMRMPGGQSHIVNSGDMRVLNATILANESTALVGHSQVPSDLVPAAFFNHQGSVLRVGNTLMDNPGGNCQGGGNVEDLGGNLDSDGSCALDPAQNIVGVSAVPSSFGDHGGLVPTVALEAISPGVDAANDALCSATDARLSTRLGGACDAGAYEFAGGFGNSRIDANGMNGLWYNPDINGHFVHVMRAAADRVYINWTTFDAEGNQTWIFAVAEGNTVSPFSAEAFVTEGGGFGTESAVASPWGTLTLELQGCESGSLHYDSVDPAFGTGDFPLRRLVVLEGTGCQDADD